MLALESVVASKDYELPLSAFAFGMLREFDLPEICAAVTPRAVWLLNPVGPQGEALPLSDAQQAYQTAARSGQLSFRVQPDPIHEVVLEWARKTLA